MKTFIALVAIGFLLITTSNIINGEEKQDAPREKEPEVKETIPISPTPSAPAITPKKKEPAAKEPTSHLTMDEIVVVGESIAVPGISVIGVKTIEKGKNINVPDVLKNEPEIDLKRRTSVGDTSDTLSIRGMSGQRITLNINGRPTNATGANGAYYIDWATVPLDNIERIEVIKGGNSVKYGNSSLGGVINVITKKPTEKPTFSLFGTYGQGNAVDYLGNYRFTHTYKIGPVGYSIASSYQKSAPFLWNNNFEEKNFSSNFYIDMPLNAKMGLGLQYADAKRYLIRENRQSTDPDNPNFYKKKYSKYPLSFGETFTPAFGTAATPGPGANYDKVKYYYDFSYIQPISDFLIDFKAYENYEDRYDRNFSTNYVNSFYQDGTLIFDRTVESDRCYGGSIEVTKPIKNHEISAGVQHKVLAYGDITCNYIDVIYNAVTSTTVLPSTGKNYSGTTPIPNQRVIADGYYIQDDWRITKNLLLTPGVRYDTFGNNAINNSTMPEVHDRAINPSLTATNKFTDNDILTVSLYEKFRTPTIPELWIWFSGNTAGKPDLKPEKNTAEEIVFQHNFSRTSSLRFSAYQYNITDYIIQRGDPNWRGTYNIDKVNIWGGSVEGKTDITGEVAIRANVSNQTSKKVGDIYDTAKLTNELDYMPEWKGNLGLEFKLPSQATLSITSKFVDTAKTMYIYKVGTAQKSKLIELNHYATMDIEFKQSVSKNGELGIYVENIFNRQYEERFGYPIAGKVAGVSLKMVF
ncbi:MAG: TonB-dependent receptor [Planctomycetota bacterium]